MSKGLISRDEAIVMLEDMEGRRDEDGYIKVYKSDVIANLRSLLSIEERKVGEWIRTGRTNVYGGEELMCPFCGDRVMVQNIEYELYCRQCGALLGDRYEVEEVE